MTISTRKGCKEPGCSRPYRARDLCSMHWKRAHGKPSRYPITCRSCGLDYFSSRPGGIFCSLGCRDAERRRTRPQTPEPGAALEVWVGSVLQVQPISTPSAPRRWVSGPCAWCGTPFTTQSDSGIARYCSHYCGRKVAKTLRRGRERGATGTYTWAEVTRKWIAIGRTCAYCRLPKRNDQIEPDHVVALCRGGSNSIVNVVPCCRECNLEKGSQLLGEWDASRRLLGLPSRSRHPLPIGPPDR